MWHQPFQNLSTKFPVKLNILEKNQAGPLLIDGEDCYRIGKSWKLVIPIFDLAILRKNGSYKLGGLHLI